MVSYEERKAEAARDATYAELNAGSDRIKTYVTAWMEKGTALYSASLTAEEQADILAMRNSLIADLRTIFGI